MNTSRFARTLLLAFFACLCITGAWAAVAPTNGGTYHLKNVRAGKYLCMTESGFSFQQTASVYDSKTIWRVTLSGTTITFQNVATDKYIGAPASNTNNVAVNVGNTATNYTLETGTYNSQSCYQFKYSTGAYSLNTGGSNFVIYTAGDDGAWFQFEEATYEAPQVVQFKNASIGYTSNYLWQDGSNLYHRSEVGSDDASKWIMYKLSANTCYLINYATGNFIHAPTSGDVLCGGTATVFTIERNGTNYLFKVGSQYLHRRNNLNGHDYTPVMAYDSASDLGSQWVMQTGATSITEAEVQTKINQNSGYATPSADSYFRLYNPSRGKHAWEDFSSLSLKGGQNDNSYKYVWRLVDGGGGKYKIQNALTQHWVKQVNTNSGQVGSIVTVANEAEATAFSIEKDAAYWGVYHWLMVANGMQMHMDGGGPVVNWNAAGANETASHWLFEHVAIDNAALAAAQQSFRDGQSMGDNVATYQGHLDALFADKACTELNAGITAANLAQNAHYTALPQAIKNMVMKVAGNSWAAYEQTFRIADYHVYSDHIQMGNVLNMGYKYCRINNPTGITAESDETILVMVGSAPPAGTTLKLEMVGTVRNVLAATGTQVELHEGLNVVNVPSRSQLYVFYEINGAENTPAYYLSNFPDITVHIEGGHVNGYFDATRGMTNADWQGMIAANLLQDERIQLKARHVMYNWTAQEVKDNNPTDILKLLNYWDDICRLENEILGLYETDATECEKYFPGQHITERFNNVFLCIGGPSGGNPHASDYGAYFTGDQSNLSNVTCMFENGGTTWCAGHELGHNHQKTFNMCCTSEVSNNFFSNVINYEMTRACSRYEAMSALPGEYAKKHNWLEYATARDNDTNGRYDSQHRLHIGWALHAQMYWKLYEYYHITGRDTRFYQKVAEILRRNGNKLNRATNVAVPATEDYLRFAEACSEASGQNLSEFFEMYGFFRLFSESDWYNDGAHLKEKDGHQCIHIDDYGDFYVYVTPEMIAATKARMAQYGEPVHGIIFVDDRFEGRVAKDGVTPRVAEGDTALGTQGDAACNVENYISGTAASAYTYSATMNADGTATVTMTGSGAPGYVLYDANGNIAYFASTSTFTVPANVVTELKNGGTQMQATVRTATTTGTDAKAMQSGTTVSEPGAFRVVRLKNKGITPDHYLTEKEGKLYHNKALSETGVYGDWVFFTKNGNTYLVNVQTGHMVQTPANNTHVSVTSAECAITKGESGDYIYIRGSNQQYLNAKIGGTVIGWLPANGNLDNNSLWTIEETGSAMSEDEVMQLIAGEYLLSAKQGVFFRMKNETRGTYAGESVNGSNHVMKGAALDATDYAQMWYLEKAGENTYYLVNALTQRKATEPAGSDPKWTMTDTGTPLVFATNTVVSTLIPHINLWKAAGTSSANALHQANTSFVWSYGIGTSAKSASEWRLETVEVNMSDLAARREAYRLGGEMLTNTADIQTKLRALFADEACTTLRSGVDLSENNDNYAGLPTMMRDMVDKINNNTWADDYEQSFRVADYKAYSNNREMAGVMGYGWTMAQLTNPTGIVARKNSVVAVMVGDEYDRIPVDGNGNLRASLKLEYVPSLRSQRAASGTQVELHKGLNVIEIPQESMLFVYYMLNSAENIEVNYLSNYPDIKIHIEGGEVNGYFDTTRGHTDDDWRGMLDADLLSYERIQFKTEHILINYPSAEFKANNPNDITPVLNVWSDIAKMEDELVGYYYGNATETDKYFPGQNLTLRCNNIWNVTGGGSDGQMYAANYGAYFGGGYDNRSNRDNLKSGSALWALGHELGHNHQKEINMLSMTEASNNMFSNATVYNFSTNTSRGYGLASVTEPYAAHRHWLEYNNTYDGDHVLSSNKWIHVILYHKLFMYFHETGRDTRFYQKLFCELRQNPMNHRKSVTEPVPASEDYLRFAEACCAASGMNLTPLFEAYGFFRLFSESDLYNGGAHTYTVDGNECIKFKDDQYGQCGLYVTQAMIDATKTRMAAYGDPVTDIIFIDDRHADAVNAAGEACTYYGLSFTHGSEGDVGSVTAFRNPVENGTASTATFTTNADGTVTVTVTPGTSAAGYVVRDASGNMLYFTAFNTFTVPASVVTAAGGADVLQSRLKVTTTSNKELALGEDDQEAATLTVGKWYTIRCMTSATDGVYMYDNNGTVGFHNTCDDRTDLWQMEINDDGTYYLKAASGKYFAWPSSGNTLPNLGASGYKLQIDATFSNTNPRYSGNLMIWGVSAQRILMMNDSQQTLNYATGANNGYSHDFQFAEVPVHTITISTNPATVDGTYQWNGITLSSGSAQPIRADMAIADAALTHVASTSGYTFTGFTQGDEAVTQITSLTDDITLTANYSLAFITPANADFADYKWLRLNNSNNPARFVSAKAAGESPATNATVSFIDEKQLWAFVGTAESFYIYNKVLGADYVLTSANATPASGTFAQMQAKDAAATATQRWKLDDTYVSAETHAGYGIKLASSNGDFGLNDYTGNWRFWNFNSSSPGSRWLIEDVQPLFTVVASVGGTADATNYPRLGELKLSYNNQTTTMDLVVENAGSEHTLWMPYNVTEATATVWPYRGYRVDATSVEFESDPDDGQDNYSHTFTFTVDESNTASYPFYNYGEYIAGLGTVATRIPAIGKLSDGRLIAATDYRHSAADIGGANTRTDLIARISADNGITWGDVTVIANGNPDTNSAQGTTSKCYSDPALVVSTAAGHEDEILVMSTHGTVGFGGSTLDNPMRVSRAYSADGGRTWTLSDITDAVYGAAGTFGGAVKSVFFTSGRILESSYQAEGAAYKRIYSGIDAKNAENASSNDNYVVYSDDFGQTWHKLGTTQPIAGGDECKVEELPGGNILLSSRKASGRYMAIYDIAAGTWSARTDVGHSAGLLGSANACNGEVLVVDALRQSDQTPVKLLLQSVPTGSSRDNVTIFYTEVDGSTTVGTLSAAGAWHTGLQVSSTTSAYSTMTHMADDKVAFFFEEHARGGGYDMVFVPLTISKITLGNYTAGSLPFKLSTLNQDGTFGDGMHWYQIKVNRNPSGTGNNAIKYSEYNTTGPKVSNSATYTPSYNTLFAFTGNRTDGYKIYSYAAGADKVLWGTGQSVPFTPVADVAAGTDWLLEYVATSSNYDGQRSGWTFRRKGTDNTYLHDLNSVMGTWNNNNAKNDAGSHFVIIEVTDDELRGFAIREIYNLVGADGYVGNYNASKLVAALTAKDHDAIATELANAGQPNTFQEGKLYAIKNAAANGGYLQGKTNTDGVGCPWTTSKSGDTYSATDSQYQWMVYNDGTSNILYNVAIKGALSSNYNTNGRNNWELQTEPAKHANIHINFTADDDKPYIFSISDPQQVDNSNHRHFLHASTDGYTYGTTNWAAYSSSDPASGWMVQEIGMVSDAVKAELLACIDCKLPKTGAFVMLQAKTSSKYATVANTSGGRLQLTTTDTPGANEIFYFDGSTLVSYGQGVYLRDGYSYGGVGVTTNNQYRFSTEESTDGSHHSIICTNSSGGGYMYAAQNNTEVNSNSVPSGDNTLWTVTTLTELPVKLSAINGSGWATLYTPVTLTVPEGIYAYTGTKQESSVHLNRVDVIPAGESVLLYMESLGAATTKNFPIGVADGVSVSEIDEENCFTGKTYSHNKTDGDMTLGTGVEGDRKFVAFRVFSGAVIPAFKAYIAAERAAGIRSFALSFDDDETAIHAAIEAEHGAEVYDLNGRRVQRAANGIYVINGKKVIIKR